MRATLYSRADCHLCEQARADLDLLQAEFSFELEVVDVDSTPELRRQYGFEVPVVDIGPYHLKAPITLQELRMTLQAAADRERQIEAVENSPALSEMRAQERWTKADAFTFWMDRHYMAVINAIVAVYLGLAFLAPILMKVGAQVPAQWNYRLFSLVCHQLSFRSFFLFGEQYVYPRAEANPRGVKTFEQATGLSESSDAEALWAAREYTGNEQVGYKVALCERDVAIYGGILLFGLIFPLTGRRIPPLPWYLWVLLGMLPIALDGVSQLVSQPPLSLIAFRESTPFYRVLTGALFGITTAWFAYPVIDESMVQSRDFMLRKWARLHRTQS